MSRCPGGPRLARATSGDAGAEVDAALARHAETCAACADAVRDAAWLRELGAALPAPRLSSTRRRALADAVQIAADADDADAADVVVRRRPWGSRVLVAAVAAAAVVAIVAASRAAPRTGLRAALDGEARWAPAPAPRRATPTTTPAPAPALAATATPAATPAPVGIAVVALDDDAAFAHDATAGEDHLVLRRGGLAIDGALAPERTIRVSAEATELRARGARFEARRDRRGLHVVRVFAGSVEIVTGARTVVVRAGETWTLPAPAAADAPATVAPASDGPDASAASTAFRTGWDHLRAGRFAAAAAALEAAAADPGLAEDAAYWAAVAWGRAGDDARARAGLAGFLDDHPASPHAGDAHLALARLLRDAGDDAAAARHLAAAADDDDPRVRAAARAAAP